MFKTKFIYTVLFCILNIYSLFAIENVDEMDSYPYTVRVSIVKTPGSHISVVSAVVTSPISGVIANGGEVGSGISDSVVGVPTLIGPNLAMLAFDFEAPMPGPNRTLHVTNSLGYDKYINCGGTYHFQDAVPLNPSGDTVIAIFVTD